MSVTPVCIDLALATAYRACILKSFELVLHLDSPMVMVMVMVIGLRYTESMCRYRGLSSL